MAARHTCSTGVCTCNGVTCSSGTACITWYLDQDGDGYGASSSFDKAGCANTAPADVNGHHYVTNNTDCDDTDARVHPGQTLWYTTMSNGGLWDYNCDGTNEAEYPTEILSVYKACKECGIICSSGQKFGYECSGSCGGVIQACKGTVNTIVGCGQSGTLYTCSQYGQESSTTVTEGCH